MQTKIEPSLDEFYKLRDAEDFFDFFKIEYEKELVDVKRFHIMKEYGQMIKKGIDNFKNQTELFDFLKFSLIKVYGEFKNGYAPSATDIWNMFKDGKAQGCLSCTPEAGNSCGC